MSASKARKERRQRQREYNRQMAFEMKYATIIDKRQEMIDDNREYAYVTSIALAIYDVYGQKYSTEELQEMIEKVINAWNKRIDSIDGKTVTYESLKKELREMTGVEFLISD